MVLLPWLLTKCEAPAIQEVSFSCSQTAHELDKRTMEAGRGSGAYHSTFIFTRIIFRSYSLFFFFNPQILSKGHELIIINGY